MKFPFVVLFGLLSVSAVCQQGSLEPELKLAIVLDKDSFRVNEGVNVSAEFRNISTKTLCFPPPDQECSTPQRGWVVVSVFKVNSEEREPFICHVDEIGAVGKELESAIRNRWIKLPPNSVYRTKPVVSKYVRLTSAGQWHLEASYHPPEGSFSQNYKRLLQSSAQKAGCTVPESTAIAEPITITVSN